MDLALSDKVVFITGASGGIGRALAASFAEEGARLVLQGARRIDELRLYIASQPWRTRALVCQAEVRSPPEIQAAIAQAVDAFGRVDVCIANAGTWPPEDLLLHETPEQRIRDVIETNLLGSVWTARAFFEALSRTGPRPDGHGASLLLIGSTAGRFGERGHADYAVSKAGLYGLLRTLKNEIVALDPYGRVNMVEPGWTVTHLTRRELEAPGALQRAVRTMPLRQLARAVDIARTALVLSSPAVSRHTSGQVLTVAGGMEGRVRWSEGEIDDARIRARLQQD